MINPIHVCIVTSAHPVDDVRVNHKIGQAFRAAGFKVSWVGPDFVYFDPDEFDIYGISYRLFSPGKGKLGRLLRSLTLYRNGLSLSGVQVFYTPDPDAVWVAIKLARKEKARVIFDIHEMFDKIMFDRWIKGPAANLGKSIFRSVLVGMCSDCDLVLGVSKAVLEPYQAAPTEKMVVRSCSWAWFAEGDPADVRGVEKKTFTFMHGKADLWRGTPVVLEALSLAKKQINGLRCIMIDDLEESLEGFGTDEFRRQVAALDLQDVVDLRQGVPMQEMPSVLRTCDAGLIAYGRKLGVESLPNRLFEYMAVGLPVIAPSYSPEICRILDVEKCGVTVDFENPAAVAAAMVQLYQDAEGCREMGRKAQNAFKNRHNWEVEIQLVQDRIHSWFPDLG